MINAELKSDLIRSLMAAGDKRGKRIYLGTHSGECHADDVLSTVILMSELKPRGYDVVVNRSRNADWLKESCDIVYDIGNGKYDHHDRYKAYYPNGIMMASCGKLINDIYDDEDVLEGLRRRLFYAVEAQDNGQELPTYMSSSLLSFVPSFNPAWDEPRDNKSFYQSFMRAVNLVGPIYERVLRGVLSDITAKNYIDSEHTRLIFNGRFMDLDKYCPCFEYAKLHEEFLGAIYPSESQWTIRLAPSFKRKYATRITFPRDWCGRHHPNRECPQEDLQNHCPIPGAIFCHPAGFLITFETKESAIKACEYILERYDGKETQHES